VRKKSKPQLLSITLKDSVSTDKTFSTILNKGVGGMIFLFYIGCILKKQKLLMYI
jgi:hypothetical protein